MASPIRNVSPGASGGGARDAGRMTEDGGTADGAEPESPEWRWRGRVDIPLFAAAALFLACYATLVLGQGLSQGVRDLLVALICAAWAFFVVDYVVRWRLSGRRLPGFVRHHPMDTLVVLMPLLRPLRIVQLYETMRHRHTRARLSLYGRVISYAGLSALLLGFAGALTVYDAERGVPGATIHTFGDSVWWACSTLTTVGYGDITPVTPLGRTVAVAMMGGGMALLGAVTGSFSSWLIQTFTLDQGRLTDGADGCPPPPRQTWTRSATTCSSLARAASRGMPFSCEPSR